MSAHEWSEIALHENLGVEHLWPVNEVGCLTERRALWQSHHHTFADVAAVGCRSNHEGVVERGRCSPFNVVGTLHLVHFRSHSTHYITRNPAAKAFSLASDSLFHGVWVGEQALG